MASQFTGLNRGQHLSDVVTGTSTNGTDIEVRIDLTKNVNELDIEIALTDILNYIRQHRDPYGTI